MEFRTMMAVAIGSLLVLGTVGPGAAQQAPQTGQSEKPAVEKPVPAKPAAKTQRLIGSLKSASEESLILEVMGKDKTTKESSFALDPKTKISRAGKSITPKDLQPGDPVAVSFTQIDGKLVAQAVTVKMKAK